jgi:hypothetical protein
MGNMFGMNSTRDDEQDARLVTLERRVLELEQKVFLEYTSEFRRSPYGKRFEPDYHPPPPNVCSNPMIIVPPLQNPNSSVSFPDPTPSMSWSR